MPSRDVEEIQGGLGIEVISERNHVQKTGFKKTEEKAKGF